MLEQINDLVIENLELKNKLDKMEARRVYLNRKKNRSKAQNKKHVTNTVKNLKSLRESYKQLGDENYKLRNQLVVVNEIIENLEDQLGV